MVLEKTHEPTTRHLATGSISRRLFLAGAAALSLTSGCRSSPRDEQTVKFWAMGREAEVVTELLPEFEQTHPDIHVRVQQLPWTAAHQKLLTAFAGDTTPDVCQLGNTWVPELVAVDALEPLDAFVARSTVVEPQDYFGGIWDTNVLNGTLYGMPWYVDTRLFFYRHDLLAQAGFAAPPQNWAEWRQMLAAIKRLVGPNRYSVLLPLNEFEPLLVLALQQEEPLLRENGRWGNFRSEGFKRTLRFYREMFERGWAPPAANTQIANVWTELGRGYYSFYISGPWNIGELKRRLPPEQQGTWMTAALPGPTGPGASNAGGSSLVIFRASRSKTAAWQLIEYLSRPEVQLRFHALTGNLPPRRTTWNDSRFATDPYARAFREQLERAKPVPKVAEWERIMDELRLTGERVALGELDIDAATAALDARVDRILEKRRWMLSRGARL